MQSSLPDPEILYNAFKDKDSSFEGIFFAGVKTTGIFCRPTCTARIPRPENVEFFPTTHEALLRGYRPCKICNPLGYKGETPDWLKPLLEEIQENPALKFTDSQLRERGLEPNRVRRWFKKNHHLTFQGYLRTLRISKAFGRIRHGEKVVDAAMESGYESLSGFNESFKKTTGVSPVNSRNRKILSITRILTPLGPMIAAADDEGICLLEFGDRRMLETQFDRLRKRLNAELAPGSNKYFSDLDAQLGEYFAGTRKTFDLPLVLAGTPFQQQVWQALQTIPYGETASYQRQAELIGNPKAVRAVARANGDNRIAIIIPCHRVIGKNGELVGYGGGIWRKKYLLDLEGKSSERRLF